MVDEYPLGQYFMECLVESKCRKGHFLLEYMDNFPNSPKATWRVEMIMRADSLPNSKWEKRCIEIRKATVQVGDKLKDGWEVKSLDSRPGEEGIDQLNLSKDS